MSFLDQLERIKKVHALIQSEKTGTAKQMAKKLKVNRSTIFGDFRILRAKGAIIVYSRDKKSYSYKKKFKLIF